MSKESEASESRGFYILRSMVGAHYFDRPWNIGHRNRYAANSIDMIECEKLVSQGLAWHEGGFVHGDDVGAHYSATEAGCRAIGLTPQQIKRAMEL